jgi:nitrite reductase/ring-hydroxylating ferredoxin subunit
MVRIGNRLEKELGHRLRIDELFRLQTITALANHYEEKLGNKTGPALTKEDSLGESKMARLIARFEAIVDPKEKDAFKETEPGIRKNDEAKGHVVLPLPEQNEAFVERFRSVVECHDAFAHFGFALVECLRALAQVVRSLVETLLSLVEAVFQAVEFRLSFGEFMTVFPEPRPGIDDAPTLLVRFPEEEYGGETNLAFTVAGYAAYSKVCTHAGCMVSDIDDTTLVCPYHSGRFNPLAGATATGGPPPRPLPQLPITLSSDGDLLATGDFEGAVGPGGD